MPHPFSKSIFRRPPMVPNQGSTETPFYFGRESSPLFGVFHAPARTTCLPAFVFCHPFAEEKLWTHRVFVSFARRLAAEGYPVLRFDYMGNGDSAGDFRDSS